MTVFAWDEFHVLAQNLAGTKTEAAQRSAVSRAYYAAFCTARNVAVKRGELSLTASHQDVWSHFKGSNDLVRRKIGLAGDRVRWMRRKADYDNVVTGLAGMVTDALRTAALVLAEAPSL